MREWRGFSNACCYVTFDSYSDHRGLDRAGFGEQFLGEHQIDAIHVLTRENDWYQHAEILEICARIRELTAGYDRVIAYGSSMGGYAAIRFGSLVGAKLAFALSPQFSIDPRRVPFEHRWCDAARIGYLYEDDPASFVETAIIAYDKEDLDARQVALYRPHTHVVDIGLLDCGHPCSGFLAELNLLQRAVLDLAQGTFDAAAFEQEARRRRRESGQYYFTLSRKSRNSTRRLALAEQAVLRGTSNIAYLANLASMAAGAGHFAAAMEALERCDEIAPAHPVVRYHRSEVLEKAGDLAGAVAALEDVPPEFVRTGAHEYRLEMLRARAAEANRTMSANEGVPVPPPPSAVASWHDVAPPKGIVAQARRRLEHAAGWLMRANALDRTRRLGMASMAVETRVTTFPSPPPFVTSWQRHDWLIRHLPRLPVDLILVGDSLAEYWPATEWPQWRVFNYGVAADKTQHVVWRLGELTRRIVAARVVVIVGTNNLGAGDTPEGIVAGIEQVVRRVGMLVPDATILAIEMPPCGPNFDFREDDRIAANRLLREAGFVRTLNVDAELIAPEAADNPYYMADHIHFTPEGYRLLTWLARQALPS